MFHQKILSLAGHIKKTVLSIIAHQRRCSNRRVRDFTITATLIDSDNRCVISNRCSS
jgi:hypothetical protein